MYFSVIDATGKLPDGIFASTLNFCSHLEKIQIYTEGVTCEVLASFFASAIGLPIETVLSTLSLISIPYGNTNALGSFEACIAAKADMRNTIEPPFEISDFKGSYIPLKLASAQSALKEISLGRMAGGISIIGDGLSPILGNVSLDNFLLKHSPRCFSRSWGLPSLVSLLALPTYSMGCVFLILALLKMFQ